MKLIYHQGANFGDALNPLIFNYYIPELFKQKDEYNLLGIGSILGLKQNTEGLKVVFSSGYATGQENTYGLLPNVSFDDWDIICVRGPLTAELLKIDNDKAISDGAILISEIIKKEDIEINENYDFGFIPHHKSLEMYSNWKDLCNKANIKFIDVSKNPKDVIKEILSCKTIISEAMHGAIIADTYRIPWIPIKLYPYINEFKWNDWALSLNIEKLNFFIFKSLHNIDFFEQLINSKVKSILPSKISNYISKIILNKRENLFLEKISNLKNENTLLSENDILRKRKKQLIEKFEDLKDKYSL